MSSIHIRLSDWPHKLDQRRGREFCLSPAHLFRILADNSSSSDTTWITLATAHPAKFNQAVELALSSSHFPDFSFPRDVLPDELKTLVGMKKRIHKVRGEQGVRDLIERVKRGEVNDSTEGIGSM